MVMLLQISCKTKSGLCRTGQKPLFTPFLCLSCSHPGRSVTHKEIEKEIQNGSKKAREHLRGGDQIPNPSGHHGPCSFQQLYCFSLAQPCSFVNGISHKFFGRHAAPDGKNKTI
ncbi:MAG: hypothetical protein IKY86_01545 [Clostridia bacterium]|nr:hypothetical protein [Clostridia bacterium]